MAGLCLLTLGIASPAWSREPVRILVITGGHDYNKETFLEMLNSLGSAFTCEVRELPDAFDMFSPVNRNKYDVLVFYHMWPELTKEQAENMAGCIREGKPLVVLHHSICAFDEWDEYMHITGGRYFHQSKTIAGKEYPPSSYEHDRKIDLNVVDPGHPVTKGLRDFSVFDETYKGFYVEPGVTPLLRTTDPTSSPVVAWTHRYGNSTVVTIQSGHDTPTYQDANFRRLLKQAILYVVKK